MMSAEAPTIHPDADALESRLPQIGQLQLSEAIGSLSPTAAREPLVPETEEHFRGIYTRAGAGAAEILAVCSAIAGEGKTTIALGLALTIAQDFPDRRVLLVETDLQRPALAQDFDIPPNPGLVEYLSNGQPIELAYRASVLNNLQFLPVGGPIPNSGRVLRSSRMAAVLDEMRQSHHVVILDLPAILVNSDALFLTDLADSLIVVVRAGVTPTSLVNKAIKQLDEEKLRGVVLNGMASAIPGWLRRICGL